MSQQHAAQSASAESKAEFVSFMMDAGVLRFGSFVTKSGRQTPYFINTGLYRTGHQIGRLGRFYADAIRQHIGTEFDVLFGPAYKGIPLAVATTAALAADGVDVAYCFNRKEAKGHGEGGVLVGHELVDGDRVVIIEDITTAGTAVREVIPLLHSAAEVEVVAMVVSVDRRERGPEHQAADGGVENRRSALDVLAEEFNMKTFAIVDVHDIMNHGELGNDQLNAMADYLDRYGVD